MQTTGFLSGDQMLTTGAVAEEASECGRLKSYMTMSWNRSLRAVAGSKANTAPEPVPATMVPNTTCSAVTGTPVSRNTTCCCSYCEAGCTEARPHRLLAPEIDQNHAAAVVANHCRALVQRNSSHHTRHNDRPQFCEASLNAMPNAACTNQSRRSLT